MQRNHHIPPRSYSQSEPYPLESSEEARAAASFVSGQFRQVFYSIPLVETVKVTPSYVAGSMSLVDVLGYVDYSNGEVEAVKVTPSYVPGSMALTATTENNTYSELEAVKVTPSYVPGSMSLPTVVQYIGYSNAELEAVKVTPSYVTGSMKLQ